MCNMVYTNDHAYQAPCLHREAPCPRVSQASHDVAPHVRVRIQLCGGHDAMRHGGCITLGLRRLPEDVVLLPWENLGVQHGGCQRLRHLHTMQERHGFDPSTCSTARAVRGGANF